MDKITFQSPVYLSSTIEGKCIKVQFDHNSGLHAKDGKELKGFVIAGEDKHFVSAQGKVDGKEIIVWSDAVEKPSSVRYGWADNPTCNLVNDADLPAAPFRTDDWPEVTFNKK